MKTGFLFLLYLSVYANSYSQRFELKLTEANDSSKFLLDESVMAGSVRQIPGIYDKLILKNGYALFDYTVVRRTIQEVKANRLNTISLLAGYIFDEMIMVADLNHNSIFTDDTVFTYKLEKVKRTGKQLKELLPLIQLDSVEIIDSAGNKSYYNTSIRFCPTIKKGSVFGKYYTTSRTTDLRLIVFSDNNFITDTFSIGDETYHIEIIPHSFISAVYPVFNSDFSRTTIGLIRHFDNDSMATVAFSYAEILDSKHKGFFAGRDSLVNWKYNFLEKNISFELKENAGAKKYDLNLIKNSLSNSLKIGDSQDLSFTDKNYFLVEFSGSWCKPCIEILPEVDSLFKEIKPKVTLFTILKEFNVSAAKLYGKKTKPGWQTYYEDINCKSATCLGKIFEVGSYPEFFLIDREGSLMYRTSGSDGVKKIKSYLIAKKIL